MLSATPRAHLVSAVVPALLTAVLAAGCMGPVVQAAGRIVATSPVRSTMGLFCTERTICDTALGVAVTLPDGVALATAGQYGVTSLALVRDDGSNSARVIVESLGTITGTNDARASVAAADALLAGLKLTLQRRPYTVAGVQGVLIDGLPGLGDHSALIVAHAGVAYNIALPGKNVPRTDQAQVLHSLRFIPRSGPFPPAQEPSPFVPSQGNPTHHPVLRSGVDVSQPATITVRVAGSDFRPNTAISLRLSWTAVPRHIPATAGTLTYYTGYNTAFVDGSGAISATIDIPAMPSAYTSFVLGVIAADGRTGTGLTASPILSARAIRRT